MARRKKDPPTGDPEGARSEEAGVDAGEREEGAPAEVLADPTDRVVDGASGGLDTAREPAEVVFPDEPTAQDLGVLRGAAGFDEEPAVEPVPADGEDDDDIPTGGEALDPARLESIVESLLFASDRPLGVGDLKRLAGVRDGKKIAAAVDALTARRADTGIVVVTAAGGWQLRTNHLNAPWVGKLLAGKPVRLSRAMMETLAIVAYRQPVTRPEIDEIRGVDSGPVLKTLLDRGLIRMIGKKEEVGRPILYGTTPEFLKTFNLKDLTELPTLREFHELSAEDQSKVDTTHGRPPPAPAAVEAADAAPGPANPFSPHPPLAPDPEEDDGLIEELEQAAHAAARAQASAEPDPETPSGGTT